MDSRLFDRFAAIAHSAAGIKLAKGKEALVAARVGKRLRALGVSSHSAYLDVLENDKDGTELVQFLDVITTNFTSFFREPDHFELLDSVLRQQLDAGQRRIRIWCAASSSGEEPYTLGITVLEAIRGRRVDARILASDISTRVLAKARAGVYPVASVGSVAEPLRRRYFSEDGVGATRMYTVRPTLRELLIFRRMNLARPPFKLAGSLDAVFCRNVMIYFDRDVRQRLISEFERLLKPGGYLVIGHTETLTELRTGVRTLQPSVYRKPGGLPDLQLRPARRRS